MNKNLMRQAQQLQSRLAKMQEELETATVEEHSRAANGWIDTLLPERTLADNIELLVLGPIVLYEVEIQVRDSETAVRNLAWGDLKHRQSDDGDAPHRR